jgi:hypothetical protein
MGIQRLQPVSGGTDWSKYSPYFLITGWSVPAGASNYNALTINGSGYIEKLINTNVDSYINVKIIIDGVTVGYYKASKFSGYFPEDRIWRESGNPYILTAGGGQLSFPSIILGGSLPTDGLDGKLVIIRKPIFFKNSLQLILDNTVPSAPRTINFEIIGGLG